MQGGTASTWAMYKTSAEKLTNEGKLQHAEDMWLAALAEAERSFSQSDPKLIYTLDSLAEFYFRNCRFREAEPLVRRSLALYERLYGSSHIDVAILAGNLAMIYYRQSKFGQAEPLFQRALELGQNHPQVQGLVASYADLLMKANRQDEADKLRGNAGDALPGRWMKTGKWASVGQETATPSASEEYIKLTTEQWTEFQLQAELQERQGNIRESVQTWQLALTLAETVRKREPRLLAYSLQALGHLSLHQQDYTKAEDFYTRSLQVTKDALGQRHVAVAASLDNLARMYYLKCSYAQAEDFARRAADMYVSLLGHEAVEVSWCYNNLATLLHVQGRYSEAEPYYVRALTIKEATQGAQHPDVLKVRRNYENLLKSMGKLPEKAAETSISDRCVSGTWKTFQVASMLTRADDE